MRDRGRCFPCKLFLAVNLRGISYLFLFAFLAQCDGVLMAYRMIADLVPCNCVFLQSSDRVSLEIMTKKVPRRWRLFSSGTTTSKCTGLASSKVSDTAPGWSFQGKTLRVGVCAKQQPMNKPHNKRAWKSFVITYAGEFPTYSANAMPTQTCRAAASGSVRFCANVAQNSCQRENLAHS